MTWLDIAAIAVVTFLVGILAGAVINEFMVAAHLKAERAELVRLRGLVARLSGGRVGKRLDDGSAA